MLVNGIAENIKVETKSLDCHAQEILSIARCPSCTEENLKIQGKVFSCSSCKKQYPIIASTIDFVCEDQSEGDAIIQRSLDNWGNALHTASSYSEFPEEWHNSTFYTIFPGTKSYEYQTTLEMGCGPGLDSLIEIKKLPSKKYCALDLGENIIALSERDKAHENLHYIRGNCLKLPLKESIFDRVLSYGVFHHTSDPQQCMNEAFRVLKNDGMIYIYLYKNHEDNLVKYIGVLLEKALMVLSSRLSIKSGRLLCWLLAPFILIFFSWPGQLLKRIKGLKKLGLMFPLHWGTTPRSIMPDLQDRLLASINHRFSKKGFRNLFLKAGFTDIEVVTTSGGHYGFARKIV